VNNPLDVEENYDHVLDFALHLTRLLLAHVFFPERLSNHCSNLRRTFSEICTKFDAHLLLDPSRNLIRPDTRLQIELRKKISTSAQLCTLTPKICYCYHLPLHRASTTAVQKALWIFLVLKNLEFNFMISDQLKLHVRVSHIPLS
jgi:hypothetical protein